MSGFELTPEQVSLRELAAEVAREVYAPQAAEWDRDRTPLPDDEVQRLAELGFLGMRPAGGVRRPRRHPPRRADRPGGAGQGVPARGVPGLRDQRRPGAASSSSSAPRSRSKDVLPKMVSGEITMAIGISEPDAGSAATDMRTRARRDGDDVRHHRQQALDLQRRPRRPLPRLLPAQRRARREGHRRDHRVAEGTPGFSFGAPEKLMGFRGIPSADLYFDEVRVPVRQRRHRGRRVQAAVRGVLDRAPRQRDDEPRDRPGVPGPHQRLRTGARAVRSPARRVPERADDPRRPWPPRWRRPGCSSTARR